MDKQNIVANLVMDAHGAVQTIWFNTADAQQQADATNKEIEEFIAEGGASEDEAGYHVVQQAIQDSDNLYIAVYQTGGIIRDAAPFQAIEKAIEWLADKIYNYGFDSCVDDARIIVSGADVYSMDDAVREDSENHYDSVELYAQRAIAHSTKGWKTDSLVKQEAIDRGYTFHHDYDRTFFLEVAQNELNYEWDDGLRLWKPRQ